MENKKREHLKHGSSSSSSRLDPPKTRSESEGRGRSGNKSSSRSSRSSSRSRPQSVSKSGYRRLAPKKLNMENKESDHFKIDSSSSSTQEQRSKHGCRSRSREKSSSRLSKSNSGSRPKSRSKSRGRSSSKSSKSNSRSQSKTRSKLRDGSSRSLPGSSKNSTSSSRATGKSKGSENLKKTIPEKMDHPKHQHPIVLMSQGKPFMCSGCKELGFGLRYKCENDRCDFILHEECAKARPTDIYKKHPLMDDSEFEFLWEPPGGTNSRYCDACGRDIRGFLYHDQYSRNKFDLHPCCMNLKRTLSDTRGTVKLNLEDEMPSTCVKCKRKDLDNVKSKKPFKGWSYVSSCGDYCYHVYCVKTLILENWEKGYFNVGSSSSSSSGSSLRGTSLVIRSETAGLSRSRTVQSDRSSITSLALVRRSARPRSFFTRVIIKGAKLGFSVILSLIFGNPTPLFAALAENLLD